MAVQAPATRTLRLLGALRESKLREHSDSFAGQEKDVAGAVAHAGAALVDMTRDRDVSGREVRLFQRPELGPWLKKPDRYDGIAVQKIDRLTRRPVDMYLFLEWLTKHGKFLISAQGDDTRTKSGRQRVELMAMVGSWEWEAIQERNQDSHERARLAGRYHGGWIPYGYRSTGSKGNWYLEPDPDQAEIVRSIVADAIAGVAYLAIADRLNDEGVPVPKKGTKWVPQTIKLIVGSPSIIGRAVHRGKELIGPDGLPIQKAEPLIAMKTYHTLRSVIDAKASKFGQYDRAERKDRTELIRVIVCPECGKNFNRARGYKTTPYRYRCNTPHCPIGGVPEAELWDVLNAFMRLMSSGVMRHNLTVLHGVDRRADIQELKDRLKRLRASREDGDWDDDLDAYKARRDTLRDRVAELEAEPVVPDREVWTPTGEMYSEFWAKATNLEKGDELRRIGLKLYVDPRVPATEFGRLTSGRFRIEAPSQWMRWKVLGTPEARSA
ncbi:recombinase family protein [Streptomyces sp. 5.8]|uniref:recombinase family protein n=1 Tax=Streptomyces sp. 5.8 TaxID=3406571 RepID=UPI003BB6204C